MSKIRGELRQLSPARRLLGLLPVLVVALAVIGGSQWAIRKATEGKEA